MDKDDHFSFRAFIYKKKILAPNRQTFGPQFSSNSPPISLYLLVLTKNLYIIYVATSLDPHYSEKNCMVKRKF